MEDRYSGPESRISIKNWNQNRVNSIPFIQWGLKYFESQDNHSSAQKTWTETSLCQTKQYFHACKMATEFTIFIKRLRYSKLVKCFKQDITIIKYTSNETRSDDVLPHFWIVEHEYAT